MVMMTLPLLPAVFQYPLGDFVAGVGRVAGHTRIVAANLDSFAILDLDPHHIMQRDGLVDGAQFVKSVRARRPDLQAEVDLREGANGDGHGKWSVAGGQWLV